MSSKAMEAAAEAVSEVIGPPVGNPEYLAKHADRLAERHRQTAAKFAQAAISAYLSTLAEDKETVERVASAVYEAKPMLDCTEGATRDTVPWSDVYAEEIRERCHKQARAALAALTQEQNQ